MNKEYTSSFAPNHIKAQVIADSIIEETQSRLTTIQVTLPRIILAELNTHRLFSRNYSSSRAIPAKVLRHEVWSNPFVPVYWGENKSGMAAERKLSRWKTRAVTSLWKSMSKVACITHFAMEKLGLHKQTCNRILEPWLTVTGVITTTNTDNFFDLRIAAAAQPEIRELAVCIKSAIDSSTPQKMNVGDLHLPYVLDAEKEILSKEDQVITSVARCCRASYNKLGYRSKLEDDKKRYQMLAEGRHMSPFEHVACYIEPMDDPALNTIDGYNWRYKLQRNFVGKFDPMTKGSYGGLSGWAQFRSVIEDVPELASKYFANV